MSEPDVRYSREELLEAKRQIASTVHKLKKTVDTLEAKNDPRRYKSQLSLARRRIAAFGIALELIDEKLCALDMQQSS